MYIHVAVHHPKGPKEKAVMMAEMSKFAEVESVHKGFVKLLVAEVEDEQTIMPVTIWESEEDFMAARADIGKYLATFDFKTNQEGPTRAGSTTLQSSSALVKFKVAPVIHPPTSK